jgi:hypothetical protein
MSTFRLMSVMTVILTVKREWWYCCWCWFATRIHSWTNQIKRFWVVYPSTCFIDRECILCKPSKLWKLANFQSRPHDGHLMDRSWDGFILHLSARQPAMVITFFCKSPPKPHPQETSNRILSSSRAQNNNRRRRPPAILALRSSRPREEPLKGLIARGGWIAF